MTLDGRKYVLNLNSGIIFGNTSYPEERVLIENPRYLDFKHDTDGIGMLIHLEDVDIDPVIIMDRNQAKVLIKALRHAIRRNRTWNRKKKYI